jgi:excisionase family DNA binding protein
MHERMLTAQQVSIIVGTTAQTVRGWVRQGRLPGIQLGKRSLRISASAVEEFLTVTK